MFVPGGFIVGETENNLSYWQWHFISSLSASATNS